MSTKAKTPKKGRPTPRRSGSVRATPQPTHQPSDQSGDESSDESGDESSHQRDSGWKVALRWFACFMAAAAHVGVSAWLFVKADGDTSTGILLLALAPALTALFVPSARCNGWLRWLVFMSLPLITHPDAMVASMVVAETWILHRFWVVEGPPRRPGLLTRLGEKEES